MKQRLSMTMFGVIAFVSVAAIASAEPILSPGDIEHVIVVAMENRSFDHLIGWVPGADGSQNRTYVDSRGLPELVNTFPLAPDYQGCDSLDPAHTDSAGREQWNQGACDGWLKKGMNSDRYCLGYYEEADLPFYSGIAANWTVLDHFFCAIMAGTWPNRIFAWAADTDRLRTGDMSNLPIELPTIFDRIESAEGVNVIYYFTDIPMTCLWGVRYIPITKPISRFYSDAEQGTLPEVAFIDPRLFFEEAGTSQDDHPKADIRWGQVVLNKIYEAVLNSPNWSTSVLVIYYDDWGGFFEHVDPDDFGRPDPAPAQELIESTEKGLRGFRVPAFVISPWAPRGSVASGVYDQTSILKMIEWNWNLDPLTNRDETANNLADVLTIPHDSSTIGAFFEFDQGPFNWGCANIPAESKWDSLYAWAQSQGWDLPPLHSGIIPALTEWGLIILGAALLIFIAYRFLRRRRFAS